MNDIVNNPYHYNQGKIECIDCIESAVVNKKGIEAVCVANVIKYLFRYEAKNGLEDVKKAQWYINLLIQELEAKNSQEETATIDTEITKSSQIEPIDEKYLPFSGDYIVKNCAECQYYEYPDSELPCSNCKFGKLVSEFPLRFSPKNS